MNTRNLLFSIALLLFVFTSCQDPAPFDPDAPTCIELSGIQDQALTLTNHIEDSNIPDYCISGNFQIRNDVTIEPGVTILMQDGSNIHVLANGSLKSVGTEDEKITFKAGTILTSGLWEGIRFATNNPNNQLVHTNISGGGNDDTYPAMVFVHYNGSALIDNCLISFSSTNGIQAENREATFYGISNTNISLCDGFPIKMTSRQIASIESNNSGDGNGDNKIELRAEQLNVPTTWGKSNFPYLLSGSQSIAADVRLEPGTRIFMAADAKIIIEGSGSFNCVGTESEKIVFRGNEPTPGFWGYIRTYPSESPLNRFEHCEISYGGGSESYPGMLYLTNNSYARVGNSEIKGSARWGIFNNNQSGNLVNDGNNTLSDNASGNIGS